MDDEKKISSLVEMFDSDKGRVAPGSLHSNK